MTTRRSNKDPLLPPTDTKAIIRASNAERRRRAQLEALLRNKTAIHVPLPVSPTIPASSPQFKLIDPLSALSLINSATNRSIVPTNVTVSLDPPAASTHGLPIMQQPNNPGDSPGHSSQAQGKQPIDPATIELPDNIHTALLEKLFIEASVKKEPTSPPGTGRINLQRYRISDGPKFRGPFQDVEAFLKWTHAVEIHFATRAVSNADDRIHLVGGFIEETNLLSLTPIRTLQRMYNFDKPADAISDFELAKWVTLGVSEELRTKIYDFGILEPKDFDYMVFEKNATAYADGISRLAAARARLLTSQARSRSPSNTPSSDFLWRLRLYLDSTGRWHFCKLHCGNDAGSCPGPLDRSHQPKAWTKAQAASKTSKPAQLGRPLASPAGVASVEDNNLCPDLSVSSLSLYRELDAQAELNLLPRIANSEAISLDKIMEDNKADAQAASNLSFQIESSAATAAENAFEDHQLPIGNNEPNFFEGCLDAVGATFPNDFNGQAEHTK
ncbi:hypothetical protein PTTG_29458 [Puccinia triticina 1-1 BBBD Race 1]|uniref:Uncharacterized protein n=1 Tax=Puccinia triticina (isolate 1-1 / race 1 (BBBD)) TaxID=630390 RepID=A0A180G3V0_PUCT1|nr:hypothetical protein PTTG_29458 [Puccinia triticina 1-1 BBBD Race 1]